MDDVKYYSQPIWIGTDSYRTTNQFHVSLNMIKDTYGIRPSIFQFRITNFKNHVNNFMTMQYSHITKLVNEIQKFERMDNGIGASFKNEKLPMITINKKKFMVFFVETKEYGQTVQIIMSTRGEDYLDSEKFFMSYSDFLTIYNLLSLSLNQYLLLSSNLQVISFIEELQGELQTNNNKLTDIKRISLTNQTFQESTDSTDSIDGIFDNPPVESTDELDINQNEFDSFVKDNIQDIQLPLVDQLIQEEKREEKKEKIDKKSLDNISDEFTEKVLGDNVLNFEALIKSCLSEKIPLKKFLEIISSKIDIGEFFPGCGNEEYLSVMYCNTVYLKEIVRRHIQEKVALPTAVYPVRCNISDNSENLRSLMYSLYSYTICYSSLNLQLKEKSTNTFENKEFYTFALKVLTSPLVYSFMQYEPKDDFVENVVNRVNLQLKRGAFNKLFESIEEKMGYKPSIDIENISATSRKTYEAIMDKWKCIDNENFMKKLTSTKISLLDWKAFLDCSFENINQVEKFIQLEFNKKKNNGILILDQVASDVKDTTDLSKFSLNILGIKEAYLDTDNLTRYCEEYTKNEVSKNYINDTLVKIKVDLSDVDYKNTDWNLFPEEVLKAIYCWTPNEDRQIVTNYRYYKEKINNCKLERDILLSMFKNFTPVGKVEDFSGALTLSSMDEQI